MGPSLLGEVMRRAGTDKYGHGYGPLYERHVPGPGINAPAVILEVGVYRGESLEVWRRWWPHAYVVGVDVDPNCSRFPNVICGDATDRRTWELLPDSIDLLIDDGSHKAGEVLQTFRHGWPRVSVGGWYVIEDLAVCYVHGYGGDDDGGPVMTNLLPVLCEWAVRGFIELHVYEEIVFARRLVQGRDRVPPERVRPPHFAFA